MQEVYTVTTAARAGQQGPAWIRWLDRYAQAHATAVTQMTVRDFPPWVVVQIDEAVEGDTATTTNFAIVVTLMARLGAARGLRGVPLAMADAVTVTQALVLEKALITLSTDALIDDAHVDDPQTGRASPLGTVMQRWLDAVLRPASCHPLSRPRAAPAHQRLASAGRRRQAARRLTRRSCSCWMRGRRRGGGEPGER